MSMQANDFIRIKYSGKIKESGLNLDSSEDAPIVVGAGWVINGVDETLKEMEVGEKRTVEIPPEKGFGQRNPNLIKLIPISEFRRHDQKPFPGMIVEADRLRGRVLSVSGGRVNVDFNHPLSGKVLVYDLEIKERIENIEDKIKAIAEFYIRRKEKMEVEIKEKEVEIVIPPLINSLFKKKIADDIIKILGFEKVRFSEIFEKPKEE